MNMNDADDTNPHVIMIRRDPDPGADPVQQHVARHFEEEVADEEHAGAEAVDRFAEPQVGEHLQPANPTFTRSRYATT